MRQRQVRVIITEESLKKLLAGQVVEVESMARDGVFDQKVTVRFSLDSMGFDRMVEVVGAGLAAAGPEVYKRGI